MTQTTDSKPQLDPKYVKEIDGRQFVLYAGLLDLAERMGLKRLEISEVLQYADNTNNHTVIVKAVAELENGKSSSDIGEANSETLPDPQVAKFVYSMASTRAKSRCLRNLCGVGITALEECASIDSIASDHGTENKSGSTASGDKKSGKSAGKQNGSQSGGKKSQPPKLITIAQLRCIKSIGNKKGFTDAELSRLSEEKYSANLDSLDRSQASDCIGYLKDLAA